MTNQLFMNKMFSNFNKKAKTIKKNINNNRI